MSTSLVRVGAIAAALGLAERTVRQLSADGVIPSTRPTGRGGHRRYEPREVVEALERSGGTVPQALRDLAGLGERA